MAVLLAVALLQNPSGVAPGEGRNIVQAVCTACQAAEMIVASHMSRKSWDRTLTWMQENQGLGALEPGVREAILGYLEAAQGFDADPVDDAENPWAYPLYRPNPLW